VALLVEARNLSKSYSAGGAIIRAVSNVSISIERGDYIAVTGRSGSGKTSLMNLLGLLERPDFGSYTFNGRDVTTLSDDQRAAIRNHEIGLCFSYQPSCRAQARSKTSSCLSSIPGRLAPRGDTWRRRRSTA
jgi:putative ABC transport system ATP-binding protein